jgi:dipeptidase E
MSTPTDKRLLLLSNSTNHGSAFLEHATHEITDFLGGSISKVLFFPFAAVRFSYDSFADRVREVLTPMGYEVTSVHRVEDPVAAVLKAEAIVVGGGNTFRLVSELYRLGLVEPVRKRVNGGIPYIGWSAGANVACPTLRTTNDMPIVEPPSFRTFDLVPFQINPHYTDAHPVGHQGETRAERIEEFVELNPDVYVVGLREGSILRIENGRIRLLGGKPVRLFKKGRDPEEHHPDQPLDFLFRE